VIVVVFTVWLTMVVVGTETSMVNVGAETVPAAWSGAPCEGGWDGRSGNWDGSGG
jgi:hypothetical protein